jgi:23S rRNA pseudouridine1911/1915/1917 synthase
MPTLIAETNDLFAVNKPAGLIVHGDGRTQEPSVAQWLGAKYPNLRGVGGDWVSPQGEHVALNGVVHRLDRTTSGVLLVAKTQETFDYLREEFKARRVEKRYLAYVHGHMEAEQGTIVAEIMRSSEPPKKWYARSCDVSEKRAAITEWKVLKKLTDPATGAPVSYLELTPKTGRTHQIRVHLAAIDHPILADRLYAPDRSSLLNFTRPALHASSIKVTLPDGTRPTLIAPLPPDFLATTDEQAL